MIIEAIASRILLCDEPVEIVDKILEELNFGDKKTGVGTPIRELKGDKNIFVGITTNVEKRFARSSTQTYIVFEDAYTRKRTSNEFSKCGEKVYKLFLGKVDSPIILDPAKGPADF